MSSSLFDGLSQLAVSVFSESILHVSTGTVLSAKVRVEYVVESDGDTYKRVEFLHFSEDDLDALNITIEVDDVLTIRDTSYKVLDVSTTGRGMSQCRVGEVI